MNTNLSVIIITKNEAANIIDCLKSVQWADEIIVVDSNSSDDTVQRSQDFAREQGILDKLKIKVTSDWPGFGKQKQRALDLATKEWVLSLDADERVTEPLKKEILNTLPHTPFDGFILRFISEYCQKKIRFGDWTNDVQMVLFRRNKGRFVTNRIHESIVLESNQIGKMRGLIHHLAFRDLSMVLRKMNDYSSASAKQKQAEGKQGGLLKALARGLWTFFRGYCLRFGFLDGKEGFLLAVSNAEGTFYRYVKLMYLNDKGFQTNET